MSDPVSMRSAGIRSVRLAAFAAAATLTLSACVSTTAVSTPALETSRTPQTPAAGGGALPARATVLPASVQQGSLVVGTTHPAAVVEYGGRTVRVAPDGRFAFGVGRDAVGPVSVKVTQPATGPVEHRIAVTPRDWPIERIDGVPPATVNPPPEIAERISREQALVAAARTRDDAREDYAMAFVWPVQGRISGRFGNQRIYNGTPRSPHSGMDIAAANGTPVRAPAAGIVTFAAPDLYLTGGTVLIDHGAGISSNFLHLSRIDVQVGDRVEQGQVFAAVGSTGRSTGPHLHWGMNWFDVRIDPLLVLELNNPP
jgi:murein DD-endopeptidase MepM/ murein hydrolase activator NlpD